MRVRLSSILSLGAIALILVIGSVYLTFGVAKVNWFQRYASATMQLRDAAGLVPRSPILLSGVPVGQVTELHSTASGVEVVMRLDRDYDIPVDSTVAIEYLSAIGEPYVEFRPRTGGGPYLEDGQLVSAEAITMPVSVPEMAHTVTKLLEQVDPNTIASLVRTFTQTLEGTEAAIPDLAKASGLLAATLLSRAPQIRAILENAQVPGPDVAKAGADFAEAGPKWGDFGVKVASVVDSIQVLLDARPVPTAYTTGTGLLQFLPRITEFVEKIGPDLQQLYPLIGPLAARADQVFPPIDMSALIEQALAAVGPDGELRLQLHVN